MVIDVLADGPTLRQAAYAIIFPVCGVLLLALGTRRRLAWRRWNRSDDDRLLAPSSEPAAAGHDSGLGADIGDLPSQPPGKGTALIVAGAIVTLLGIGHVLSYVSASHAPNTVKSDLGQCITAADFQQRLIAEFVECDHTDASTPH